jgi:hypothetical protein
MSSKIRSPKTGRMVTIGGQAYKDLVKEGYISKNRRTKPSSRQNSRKRKGSDSKSSKKSKDIAKIIYSDPKLSSKSNYYKVVWLPKIHENLFLSNFNFGEFMAKKLGFSCIVNVTKDPYIQKSPLTYVSIPISDDFEMTYNTFSKNVNACTKKLAECLKKGPTVVHCVEGMNRSVTCIVSYALRYGGVKPSLKEFNRLVRYIKSRKAQRGYGDKWYTLTNPAFRKHLKTLHSIK